MNMGVSKNRGTPKWMVYFMENPMNKWMIWGENPYFWFNTHIHNIYIYISIGGGFIDFLFFTPRFWGNEFDPQALT